MITSWDIYWVTRLDAVCGFIEVVLILVGILFLVSPLIFMAFDDGSLDIKYFWRGLKICVVTVLFFLFAGIFIPSTKEVAAIYLIPKIANNEQVQKIPDNAAKLLNAKLEEWIDGTLKDKKSKK